MQKFSVLVVEDESRILNFLKTKLKASGYRILTACNGFEGLEQVHSQEPDLIVLDVLMPKMSGIDMLKELRTFSHIPVIILSAKGADEDKIRGLDLGADDYLPKPFNPQELISRIEAIRRRLSLDRQHQVVDEVSIGNVTVDFKGRCVRVDGESIYLTRIEWLILSELASNVGRLMLYDQLLTRVWGPEYRNDVQLLRTWVSRLRNKLEKDPGKPTLIRTIPKTGYIIDSSQPAKAG